MIWLTVQMASRSSGVGGGSPSNGGGNIIGPATWSSESCGPTPSTPAVIVPAVRGAARRPLFGRVPLSLQLSTFPHFYPDDFVETAEPVSGR
jgi:hypothetical protein